MLCCTGAAAPVYPRLAAVADGPVVVLVPGVTGSQLRHRESGRIVWGDARAVFLPHDRGHALAWPLAPGGTAPALEPFAVVEEVRFLGVFAKQAYAPILRLMAANGYRTSSLLDPDPAATFFVFPYDWRLSNVETAGELARRLEALRRRRGAERLEVALLCQSSGAYACRYLAKYGGASLEEAEAGEEAAPPGLRITHVILAGTSNGGSLRILREMNRGRTYVALVGRRWAPETLFTFASLYEDLPAYRSDLFFDARGAPVEVDLYDPASWRRYGFSIYGREVQRLSARGELPDLFADARTRNAFLERMLDRARRLQRLLAADAPGFGRPRYALIQSTHTETPERALLVEEDGRWRTYFTGDRRLARNPFLHALATSPGDGHATEASQLWLSPQEKAALAGEPLLVRGRHFELILAPAAQRRILEILRD